MKEKTAKRMAITVEELNKIRRQTLSNAIKAISLRQPSKANVTKTADIALVT